MKKILPQSAKYILLIILMLIVSIGFLIMLVITDAFSSVVLLALLCCMVILMFFATSLIYKKKKALRTIGAIISIAYIIIFGMGIYYLVTTNIMLSKITLSDTEAPVKPNRTDVIEESFNVYITGIDQWTVNKGYDLERSDINMIATVCPKTRKILLTSIPRDAYVPLHRTGTMDKLTHTGIYGVDETLNTVHDWTGLDFNYYVKVNFTGCVHIIDAIDGVDVYSPTAFHSSISKYSYKKGWNHLQGHEALYFARERKSFMEEQDQIRVVNQQRVIKAMLDKIMSSKTFLTKYGELMEVISEDMETNMPAEDIKSLVKMQMIDLSAWDIEMQRMTGDYTMKKVASLSSENEYLVLIIKDKDFTTCLKNINKTMNPTTKEVAKATAEREKNAVAAFLKGIK